jgi:hypothetical protein
MGIGPTNVLAELPHEGNAELADFVVGLALGVKVGTTLGTAHVHCAIVSAHVRLSHVLRYVTYSR